MPVNPPRLIAYLDEAGCAGSKYGEGSSRFLVIAAVVLSADQEDDALAIFDEARAESGHSKCFRKFSKASDGDNFVLTRLLPSKRVRLVQVALHKPSMTGRYTRNHHKEEYQYLVKMVLERVSWLARDAAKKSGESGKSSDPNDNLCQLVFSEQKLYSYDDLCGYLNELQHGQSRYNCSVEWPFIHPHVRSRKHEDEQGLHLADIAASALFKAIEPLRYGMTDDRFQRNLVKAIARFSGKPFGLKLFPPKEVRAMIANGDFQFLKLMA